MLVETWLELGSKFFHEKEYMCCLILDRLGALNANIWNLPCGSYFWPKFWGIQGNKSAISYYWSCQLSSLAALRCPRLQSSVCRDYTEQRKDEGLFEQISWGEKNINKCKVENIFFHKLFSWCIPLLIVGIRKSMGGNNWNSYWLIWDLQCSAAHLKLHLSLSPLFFSEQD